MKVSLLLIQFSVAMLSFSNVSFGQVPVLGGAAAFSVFTSVGAFNNLEATYITGDIGTNAGAFTGFPAGVVAGQIHVADVTSAIAAIDVGLAYGYLAGLICDTVVGVTLGSGQRLTPHTYCIGAAATLNGNLVLDGLGNPGAVFIFRIDGAFATGISSKVILVNSASFDHVYWQINGQVDLGDSSIFRGTIVANGAINLLERAFLQGRALSQAGAISLHNNIVGNLGIVPLSVTLVQFSVARQGNSSLLKWSTANEQNSRDFTAERSNSAQLNTWETVGTVPAAGNSTTTRQYSLKDNDVHAGTNYYRLHSTGMDGSSSISPIVTVQFNTVTPASINVFPNPATNSITMTGAAKGSTITLADMAGRFVNAPISNSNSIYQVATADLIPGAYLLKIVAADGNTTTIKLNKQ